MGGGWWKYYSGYLTGLCRSLSSQGLRGKCRVIMLLLRNEWLRAAQSLQDAEAAECLSELKALFRI